MSFDRNLLPDPTVYFTERGLKLTGSRQAKWKTTSCQFHNGSDSMRINTVTGGWCCMACGVHGGDVLAYEMQADGLEFVAAAKALGAWVDDGREPPANQKPAPLPARSALELLSSEAMIAYVVCCDVSRGIKPSDTDMQRLGTAVARIAKIAEAYHA